MLCTRKLAVFLALCIAAGCGKSEPSVSTPAEEQAPAEPPVSLASAKDRDVIVVVVDGLRGDKLEATPYIGELAGQGLNFQNAASSSSHVMQSLSSFFTGRLPTRGGAIGVYEAEPQEEAATIAQAFQDAGYYTGLLANHPAIQGFGYTKGFQEVQVAQQGQPLNDTALVKRATEFLEDAGTDRIFLYVHFAGVLTSKLVQPDPAADPATAPFNVRDFGKDYKWTSEELKASPRVAITRDAYAAAMNTSDAAVKALMDALKTSGRLEKSVVVLTSLHGFELLEHAYLGTGWSLYEESVHVPLIVYAPGAVPAAMTRARVSLVDVMPSLLTLTGVKFDAAPLDGQILFQPDGDTFTYTASDRPRIAELVIPERCIVRTVSNGEWKYVAASAWADPVDRYTLAESHRDTANAIAGGTKSAPSLWGAQAREEMVRIPGETLESAATDASAKKKLLAALAEYQKQCEQTGIPPRAPTVSAKAVDAEQIENLESLGYL